MRATVPIDTPLGSAKLTSSTVAEPDTASGEETISGSGHDLGDVVISTSLHWAWESAVGSNADPLPTETGVSTDNWLSIGPSMKWRMLYLNSTIPTTGASPMTVVITPSERFDTVGLVGLVADSVTITLTNGVTEVFTETRNLKARRTRTWTEYLNGKFRQTKVTAFLGLQQNSAMVLTLEFTRASGDISVGGVAVGQSVYMGKLLHGAKPGAINFSRFTRADTGELSELVRRQNRPRLVGQIRSKSTDLGALMDLRDDINGRVVLVTGLDQPEHPYYGALVLLGVCQKFEPDLDQPEDLLTDIEFEGP